MVKNKEAMNLVPKFTSFSHELPKQRINTFLWKLYMLQTVKSTGNNLESCYGTINTLILFL